VRHGFGYTHWRHSGQDLELETTAFVPRHEPVKVTRLRVTNTSDRPRRLSIFSYHRLVLGVLPSKSARFVVTELAPESGAILAHNRLNDEFSDAVVFAAAVAPNGAEPARFTGDRTGFIGRNGSPAAPAALVDSAELDGKTGAGLDPCAAVQVTLCLAPHGTVECAFLFGEATGRASASALTHRYRHPAAIDNALQEVREYWTRTLSAVRVETPSPEINVMVNGWLVYQALSCRLWGRSAFYQSGGAFGFRDQLQDAAALVYARPDMTRAQILLHAAHQFVEGDVLHWWHPPTGRGTRTRFSDDLLWLPYVAAFYVHTTGDWSVLDELAGFVCARALEVGEDEAYLLPVPAEESATVYAHCCRALDRSLTRGTHGLPLMGTGDWNDGMNRVGREGGGESVWVGFFAYRILDEFIPICERRGDHERAQRYREYQTQVRVALDEAGWDGRWYRRAYYDDGTPLGSAQNEECRIDALAQAWAVISKAAPPERAAQAMDAVEQHLVSADAGIIRLLTPPFDHDPRDPGYIKGYVPGIRENGGQYTHAAIWVVQALAELGRRHRAAALLEMLGPVSHTRTPQDVAVYQVEPYVVAADVYGAGPHVGRGGWTWYTGSAGWMYRVALESVLGVRLEGGDTLTVKPCIPDHWSQYGVTWRLPDGRTRYEIVVHNPTGQSAAVQSVVIDGRPAIAEGATARIPLVRDGGVHRVSITLGDVAEK
jgi:cyclic beta-1,2-glucan synthetase